MRAFCCFYLRGPRGRGPRGLRPPRSHVMLTMCIQSIDKVQATKSAISITIMCWLSWTKSTPSRNPVQTPTSPTRTSPKHSYSQVAIRRPPEPATKPGQRPATKENLRPRDPGKSPPRDLARDLSRDVRALKQARDLTALDRGNLTH